MKFTKVKFVFFAVAFIFLIFFSSDFGLIDIEKTAIITAIAIDVNNNEYELTAQISVPEATDSNSETSKAHITGKGKTMGAAFKDLGEVSGWFPNLNFCNLIILSNDLATTNSMKVLDYFARTLRMQDSALVVLFEGKAKEIIKYSTPLDNISAFAIQKILFKNAGFDIEVAKMDIKTFAVGYYSKGHSSYMPIIKTIEANENPQEGSQQSSSSDMISSGKTSSNSSNSSSQSKKYFSANYTALFNYGIKVGQLDPLLTTTFNILTTSFEGSTFEVNNVSDGVTSKNYLLTVLRNSPSLSLDVSVNKIVFNVNLDLYCKVSDQNSEGGENGLIKNIPIPNNVIEKAQQQLTTQINNLIEVSKKTGCDFFEIADKLYRRHNKFYALYKDNYLDKLQANVKVKVQGQR